LTGEQFFTCGRSFVNDTIPPCLFIINYYLGNQMAGNTYWDSVLDRLHEIERDWTPSPPPGGVITTAHRGMPGLSSGIITTTSQAANYIGGILYAMPGASAYRSAVRRAHNVAKAINESFPAAFGEIEKRLGGIKIDSIEDVLIKMLRDVAITLGGSTVIGAGIGGAVGSLAFGIGAAPGAGIGATAGFEMGNLILTFTGLKSIISFMKDAVPAALTCYDTGFSNAWGKKDDDAPYASWAYRDFAMGHVLFFMAILMGIVGYLMRGKGNLPILLGEIRASPKLGGKFADWIELNQDSLMRNPALQQGMRMSTGAASDEAPAVASQMQGPLRGQKPTNLIDPNAPISAAPATPAETLAKVNQGRAPYSELNAAVAEAQGYNNAINNLGHIGIEAPGKASVQGPDFITLDPAGEGTINVWDAKYRGPNATSWPTTIPDSKMASWASQISDAVNNMPAGTAKDMALDALQNGRVVPQVFKWP
jgi:hypothetical protein